MSRSNTYDMISLKFNLKTGLKLIQRSAFNHRNADFDNEKYRHCLYNNSDPSECSHGNAILRVNNIK